MKCNPDPLAPHGFNRNASHNEGRYVCECESWDGEEMEVVAMQKIIDDLQSQVDEALWFANAYKNTQLDEIERVMRPKGCVQRHINNTDSLISAYKELLLKKIDEKVKICKESLLTQ